jgi:hypothetical protein
VERVIAMSGRDEHPDAGQSTEDEAPLDNGAGSPEDAAQKEQDTQVQEGEENTS